VLATSEELNIRSGPGAAELKTAIDARRLIMDAPAACVTATKMQRAARLGKSLRAEQTHSQDKPPRTIGRE